VEHSLSHIPTARVALTIVAAAALLLFALGPPAAAGSTDASTTLAAAEASTGALAAASNPTTEAPASAESPSSAEPAPPSSARAESADVSQPKVTEAADASETTSVAAQGGSPAASSSAPSGSHLPVPGRSESAVPPAADSAASTASRLPQAGLGAAARSADGASELAAGSRVSELDGRIGQASAEPAVVAMRSAKTAVQAVAAQAAERVPPTDPVQALSQPTLQVVGETLPGGLPNLVAPFDVESLLTGDLESLLTSGKAAGEALFSPQLHAVSNPSTAWPVGARSDKRSTVLEGLTLKLAAFGGVEPSRFGSAGLPGDPATGGSSRALAHLTGNSLGAAGGSLGNAGGRSMGPIPSGGNDSVPSPSSSQPVASGVGGSSFVPIVALLALLALAAAAILRRLGEGPALRAPLPFVCALERPG
jgi:hypothetical protein